MRAPTDNETWVIETGDTIVGRKTRGGIECLSPWETLVYCFWVADYGMRNAGDLDAAADVYAEFHSNARRIAEVLSLRLTHEAFSLPQSDLEREYFDRFECICNEIRAAERRAASSVFWIQSLPDEDSKPGATGLGRGASGQAFRGEASSPNVRIVTLQQ
jgi:hypothetical protein